MNDFFTVFLGGFVRGAGLVLVIVLFMLVASSNK